MRKKRRKEVLSFRFVLVCSGGTIVTLWNVLKKGVTHVTIVPRDSGLTSCE